jgi:Transposase DDE domain
VEVWLSDEAQAGWSAVSTSKRGHPQVYSDIAIATALTIGSVFGLPLRGTQGFVDSLLGLLKSGLTCPDYSTLCRRRSDLTVKIPSRKTSEPLVIAIIARD